MSDIKKYRAVPTGRLHLRDAAEELMYADGPGGAPDKSRPMVAVLYGPGSKQYAKAQAAENNRYIDKLRKQKGKTDQSAEEQRRELVKRLVLCTEAFENVDYDGLTGGALFEAVYSDIEIGFIADQVAAYIRDWENFSKPSTTSSGSTSGSQPG